MLAFFFALIDTLTGSRMICNCDFYETRTVIHQMFNVFFKKLHMFTLQWDRTFIGDPSNIPHLKCENLQELSDPEFLINPDSLEKHHFQKVIICASNDIMIVKTKTMYRFRMLIQIQRPPVMRKSSKCPTKKWIRETVNCALLTSKKNELPIAQFLSSTFPTTFCALLPTSPKRPWLLHCQTIGMKLDEYKSSIVVWVIWSCTCLVSGFFGVFVVGRANGYVKSMRTSKLTSQKPVGPSLQTFHPFQTIFFFFN